MLSDAIRERHAFLTITRFAPLPLKRRGIELRIVMEREADSNRTVDITLLKAMASGSRWFSELASVRARDTLQIARREGLGDRYVRRLIPLAFMAPSIVEAIRTGRQPANLSAEWPTRAKLPLQWVEQRNAFGMSQRMARRLIDHGFRLMVFGRTRNAYIHWPLSARHCHPT
jgi:site-specific DNA recombinase